MGTYIDTEKDFQSRKCQTLQTQKKFDNIFKSKIINKDLKIRTFNVYIACIFLYNSETWVVNKTLEDKIDSLHRRLLRYTLGIQYPDTITNRELKRITNTEPWSTTIRRRRLNLLGHVMRLPPDTPIRKAIQEVFNPCRNKVGHPKHMWLHTIKEDLARININLRLYNPNSVNTLTELTRDRVNWRRTVTAVLMQ